MKMLFVQNIVLAILTFFNLFVWAHPIKMSVCDVSYNNNVLTMHYKLFQDDFMALANSIGKVDFEKRNNPTSQLLIDYLTKQTNIKINGKELTIKELTYSKDATLVHIWLSFENVKLQKDNKIEIRNSILFEQYTEQINMYYIDLLGDKNPVSCRLGKDFPSDTWIVPYK